MSVPQTPPDTVFCVLHHYATRRDAGGELSREIHTVTLGLYWSFFAAQAVAVDTLNVCLGELRSAGAAGHFCQDIDLWRRGLITLITRQGQEEPLSEFEIRAIPLQDRIACGIPIIEADDQRVGPPETVVTPLPKDLAINSSDIERDPLWAQTRVPYFRKRDEGLARYTGDPSSTARLLFGDGIVKARGEAAKQPDVEDEYNKRDTYDAQEAAMSCRDLPSHRTMISDDEVAHQNQPSKPTEEAGTENHKSDCTRLERQIASSDNIGPIYCGRRHSTLLG